MSLRWPFLGRNTIQDMSIVLLGERALCVATFMDSARSLSIDFSRLCLCLFPSLVPMCILAVEKKREKRKDMQHLGGSVVEHLPLAQVMIPGS